MMVTGHIREAVVAALDKFSGAVVENGRVSRYEETDFENDIGDRVARITVNTFATIGSDGVDEPSVMDGGNNMSGCCVGNRQTQLTISIVLPINEASEPEMEAIEEQIWPLLATVDLPDDLTMEFVQSVLQPAQVNDSFPVASRTMEFGMVYGFDMSTPAQGHRI